MVKWTKKCTNILNFFSKNGQMPKSSSKILFTLEFFMVSSIVVLSAKMYDILKWDPQNLTFKVICKSN